MASPILEIAAIRLAYDGHAIFDGFDFAQEQGEHRLLLGPSGSGKTSLINMIAGLRVPDAGRVTVDGEPMSELSAPQRDDLRRRKIGVIFQTLRLISALTVHQNLALAQRLSGAPRDKAAIDGLLDAVGIAHRAHQLPRRLSQGEAQRAAIARALVAKPVLLIADEPTSALDDANAARVAQLLLDTANANGSTLLVATHDARLQAHIPDSVEIAPIAAEAA